MTTPQTAEAASESDEAQQLSTSMGLSVLGMVAIATTLACVWVLLSAGPVK